MSWRKGNAVVLAEANVDRDELLEFFGDGRRLHMLFNFTLNDGIFLALARESAGPIREALRWLPSIPDACGWATFLRLHDEVDLSRLSLGEREECFAAFGPDPEMRLYERGIRRRLASMLGGDRRLLELAYALQFSLPGTPVLRYGEEIGMGEDLSLRERLAIRTPMQWSDERNGGFSTARKKDLIRPVIDDREFGYERVNVDAQRNDDQSLLAWFERMLRVLRECPESGEGECTLLDSGLEHVLALRFDGPSGTLVAISNLRDEACVVDLAADAGEPETGPRGVRQSALRRAAEGHVVARARRLGLPLAAAHLQLGGSLVTGCATPRATASSQRIRNHSSQPAQRYHARPSYRSTRPGSSF